MLRSVRSLHLLLLIVCAFSVSHCVPNSEVVDCEIQRNDDTSYKDTSISLHFRLFLKIMIPFS